MTDNVEHKNWIRYHSLRQAKKITKSNDIDKLINDAAKIAAYVLNEKKGEVKLISDKGKKGNGKKMSN